MKESLYALHLNTHLHCGLPITFDRHMKSIHIVFHTGNCGCNSVYFRIYVVDLGLRMLIRS